MRESYNNVALNTTLVASQLSTIRAALEALYAWRSSDQDSTEPSRQLDKDLGMSLSCCAILISVIDGKLDDSGHMPGLKQKIRYLWLEDILKEYISNLEGQVRALQLLLTIFQCRTATERRQKLGNEESRTIMEQVRAETASLAFDNQSFQDAASVLSLNPSVSLEIDSILLKSPAYRRVYGNARPRLPPSASASPVENSDEAAYNPTLQRPPLPPRPTRPAGKSTDQSRDRINVWDFYAGGQEEEKYVDETIITHTHNASELEGESQGNSAPPLRNEETKKEQSLLLQREDTAMEGAHREVRTIGGFSEDKHTFLRTEDVQSTVLPTVVADAEPSSTFEGFMHQLKFAFEKSPSQDEGPDLGLSYATAVASKVQESNPAAVTRDEASHTVSHKGAMELDHRSSQLEDSSLDHAGENGLQNGLQRQMSTHSSLYDCSIIPASKQSSTRTSSPFSCDSCKNLNTADGALEEDNLEAERHDSDHSSTRPDSGNPSSTQDGMDQDSRLASRNQSPDAVVSAGLNTSKESQSQHRRDVVPHVRESPSSQGHPNNMSLQKISTGLTDGLTRSESEDVKPIATSRASTSLRLQHVNTPEANDHGLEETKDSDSSIVPSSQLITSAEPSPRRSSPAVVLFPSEHSRNPESEQLTLSSQSPSSVHDATSTISSSEVFEDSTDSSLQQTSSNTIATTVTTHAPETIHDQAHPEIPRLQNEFAAAKGKDDSRGVHESIQRSIGLVRQRYMAEAPGEVNRASTGLSNSRPGKARSTIRLPFLAGSAKGVALGDLAALGSTILIQKLLKENVSVDARSDGFKTPMMRAAINGHIECMSLLKHHGADEFAVDARGRTALHLAVASNQMAVVQWMLETYPPPKPDPLRHRPSILLRATDVVKGVRSQKNLRETSDAEGSKPLHIAAELDKGNMVKTLLAAGVEIESKDNWGRTSFHRAIISKRRDSFDVLLQNAAKVAAVNAKSVSSLHMAAQTGQVDMMETLLTNGVERWGFDADGNQPIHSAVWGGNPLAIEALVTEKADFDKRTRSGATLLHLACLKKDLELAKYLLTNLVNINPWAPPSPSMLQFLSHTRIKASSMTPLHYACCTQDFEMALLLLDHDALVNAPSPEGATALMMAVETEDTNLVNLLLQRGAKVNAKIPGSLITALHLAARRGDLETVQQLCRHRADDSTRAGSAANARSPLEESMKCSDKKKGQAVEQYIRTVIQNRINNTLRANARIHQGNRAGPSQTYHAQQGTHISAVANAGTYAPWGGAQSVLSQNPGEAAQRAQMQSPQYYHPDFDVPDETLPPYEPGPSAPAHLVHRAPVHRENDS